jgi:hypothetical protein
LRSVSPPRWAPQLVTWYDGLLPPYSAMPHMPSLCSRQLRKLSPTPRVAAARCCRDVVRRRSVRSHHVRRWDTRCVSKIALQQTRGSST